MKCDDLSAWLKYNQDTAVFTDHPAYPPVQCGQEWNPSTDGWVHWWQQAGQGDPAAVSWLCIYKHPFVYIRAAALLLGGPSVATPLDRAGNETSWSAPISAFTFNNLLSRRKGHKEQTGSIES